MSPHAQLSTPYLSRDIPMAESFKPTQQAAMDSCWFTKELKHFETCLLVLDVIESFGTHIGKDVSARWAAKPKFLGHVFHWVRRNEPVQLTMPAFPCKSANRNNKVLGHLPDLGEELGLSRLNDIAVAIRNVYQPGALVYIASDGILFNDIIGVSDEETWDYSEGLRAIAREKKLDSIVFLYPQVLIGMMTASDMTRERYMSTAAECRILLEARFGSTIEQIERLIKADPDTNSTYCGMVKFLQTELHAALASKSYRERQKLQKSSAKKMMQRSEAFTLAIRTHRPMDIRLSMHPSSGGTKLSVALIPSPEGLFQKSPWHSCVAIDGDGGYHCVHSDEVRDTHDLVYRDSRPYFYMSKEAVGLEQFKEFPAAEEFDTVGSVEKQDVLAPIEHSVAPAASQQEIVTFFQEKSPVLL